MWEESERIAWATLEHNYGDAADVPALLRGCANRDPEQACDALAELSNLLYHQGGWVCSAAAAALPFLLDLALDPAVHHRHEIVELIGRIAREATTVQPGLVDDRWPNALAAAAPRMLRLLADEDPRVRREATLLAAGGGLPYAPVTAELWRRWRAEPDRVTRWDLALALGELLAKHPDATEVRAELHRLLDHPDVQLRLAAVHALAGSEAQLPATRVADLIRAVTHVHADGWQQSAWIGGTRATIVHATGRLLHRDPPAEAAFTIGVSRSTDVDERVDALAQAGRLLAEWRTSTTALLPFLADHLDDPEAEVRYRAAFLLGCLGTHATAQSDRLAELASDATIRDSRRGIVVGDAAVWALARQHDPRCLPGLIHRLTGDRLGFDTVSAHHPREEYAFRFAQPGIHEVLGRLREHAGDLVDAVTARITASTNPVLVSNLCDVLATWGPAAQPAIPILVVLLADDHLWPAAARALGGIGPAAAPATDTLQQRTETHPDEPAAAWAHWRVSGDPGLAVNTLIRLTDGKTAPATLRHLTQLGPLAAPARARLRQLTESTDEWVRTEAAHALWRVSADPTETVPVLSNVVLPLTEGRCQPVMRTALRYLAEIGAPAVRAAPTAQAVLNNPRRLAYFGGWRTFTEDEEVRTAAVTLTARCAPATG